MFLKKEIAALTKMIGHSKLQATKVSAKGVDWHLDHSLKVIIGLSKALKNSDPSAYQNKFNLVRSYIFFRGSIPRGKGKSPKAVLPPDHIQKEDLFLQLDAANELLNEIENLSANHNFKHPYFGVLNLKKTQQFLELHTEHHLKIMRDILRSVNN